VSTEQHVSAYQEAIRDLNFYHPFP